MCYYNQPFHAISSMSWAPSVPNSAPQTSFSRPPWCFWEAKIANPSQVKLLEVAIHHLFVGCAIWERTIKRNKSKPYLSYRHFDPSKAITFGNIPQLSQHLLLSSFRKSPTYKALLVNFLLVESHARNFAQLVEVCWHITSQQAISLMG